MNKIAQGTGNRPSIAFARLQPSQRNQLLLGRQDKRRS